MKPIFRISDLAPIFSFIFILILLAIPLGFLCYLIYKYRKEHKITPLKVGIFIFLLCSSAFMYGFFYIIVHMWAPPPKDPIKIPTPFEQTEIQ